MTRSVLYQVIRRMPGDVFDPKKFIERQLHSGPPTKLLTFQDAILFIMALPGQIAMKVRQEFARIITAFEAGDQRLIGEINANAASNSPIAQMARSSLGIEPAVDELSLTRKRRMEELEIEQLEVEIASKKLANEAMARDSEREHLIKIGDRYRELCQDTVMDERMRLMLKDGFMNMALAAQKGAPCQGLLANGGGVSPNTPISLSLVANDLKLKIADGDWKRIGIEVSKRYLALHGKRPSKHRQTVGAQILDVNDYYESDRPLVEQVLRWHVGGRV